MACQIKGQSFNGLLVGLETLRGADARLPLLPMLNDELKLLIEKSAVMSSGWYPLSWYSEVPGPSPTATSTWSRSSWVGLACATT